MLATIDVLYINDVETIKIREDVFDHDTFYPLRRYQL